MRHGGEASDAARAFQTLPSGDQQRVVQLVRSL